MISNLSNYLANNAWTFLDRGHRGWALVRGYASYLFLSLVGLSASTATFAALSYGLRQHFSQQLGENYSKLLILGFQLVSILVGTFFNYELNRRVTWRDAVKANLKKNYSLDAGGVDH